MGPKYPDQSEPGDCIYFVRQDHECLNKPVWEAQLGGALARCPDCGDVVAFNVEVLQVGLVHPTQLSWVREVLLAMPGNDDFFLN